jgi:hypothetical protein
MVELDTYISGLELRVDSVKCQLKYRVTHTTQEEEMCPLFEGHGKASKRRWDSNGIVKLG